MSDHTIEPGIIEAVHAVANRYGAPGLEEMIGLAEQELVEAREALRQLAAEQGGS